MLARYKHSSLFVRGISDERKSFVTLNATLISQIISVSFDLRLKPFMTHTIGDDISIKGANVKLNINDVCNLISVSNEHFN